MTEPDGDSYDSEPHSEGDRREDPEGGATGGCDVPGENANREKLGECGGDSERTGGGISDHVDAPEEERDRWQDGAGEDRAAIDQGGADFVPMERMLLRHVSCEQFGEEMGDPCSGADPCDELERVKHLVRNVHLKDNRGGYEDWYFPAVGAGGSVDFGRNFAAASKCNSDSSLRARRLSSAPAFMCASY